MDKVVDYTQPQADRIVVGQGEITAELRELRKELGEIKEMLGALDEGQGQVFWAAGGTIAMNQNKRIFSLARKGEEVLNAEAVAGPQIVLPPGLEAQAGQA
jgi:hypothetical protein